MEKLSLFFTKIKELNFWQRLFSWGKVRILSYEALEEFANLKREIDQQRTATDQLNNSLTRLETEKKGLEKALEEIHLQQERKETKIEDLNLKIAELKDKVSRYESIEEERKKDYEKKIAQLTQAREDLDADRNRLNDDRRREQEEEYERMKRQWSEHEKDTEQHIRRICQENVITYIDEYPHRGKPDNAIEISGELIIFDAKSPANDNFSNFPTYIKNQTKNLEKYAKQKDVKKDIFLVIPSNTVSLISQFTYNMGNYNVFIITKDALEPVILSLKKIEDYEFAEQLSPEERDNICRVIGKFTHTTKRKIQIDQFFANQFIELLVKCGNDLPEDILNSVIEFEKAEVLNPTTERRNKTILTKDLKEKNESINAEATHRKIEIPGNFDDVKKLK